MKVSSAVPVVILVAEVALAIPAAVEHGHVSGLVLNDRGIPCFVEGNCGGIDSQLPGSDYGYPTQTSARSVCFPGIGRRADRTLVTVASSVTSDRQADPESTPGTEGFMNPTLHDRETPCIAEDNCGGINTQQPASSPPPPTTPLPPATTVSGAMTTTMGIALTPYSGQYGSLIAPPSPALSCWEADNGQVHCVPTGSPSPASSVQTKKGKKYPILPRETGLLEASL